MHSDCCWLRRELGRSARPPSSAAPAAVATLRPYAGMNWRASVTAVPELGSGYTLEQPSGLPATPWKGPGTRSTWVLWGSYTVGVSTLPTMPASSTPTLPGQRDANAARIAPGQSAETVEVYERTPEKASVSACVPTSASVKITL